MKERRNMRSVSGHSNVRRDGSIRRTFERSTEVEGGWPSGRSDTGFLASTGFGTEADSIHVPSGTPGPLYVRSWLSATNWRPIRAGERPSPASAPNRSISSSSDGAAVSFPPSRTIEKILARAGKTKRSRATGLPATPLSRVQARRMGDVQQTDLVGPRYLRGCAASPAFIPSTPSISSDKRPRPASPRQADALAWPPSR